MNNDNCNTNTALCGPADTLDAIAVNDSSLDFDFDFDFDLDFNVSNEPEFHGIAPLSGVPSLLEESTFDLLRDVNEAFSTSEQDFPVQTKSKSQYKLAKGNTFKHKKLKKPTKKGTMLTKKGLNRQAAAQPLPVPVARLIPPPILDKGDSLVFVPHSFVRFVNIGDVASLSKLLMRHAAPTCEFNCQGHDLMLRDFLSLIEIFSEIHPDKVNCVHTTKIVNNTVQSKMFSKFIHSRAIYRTVALQRGENPFFKRMFGNNRALRCWKQQIASLPHKTDAEKAQMISVVDAPGDMVAYANYHMTLTFDDATRQLTKIDYAFELCSLTLVDEPKSKR